MRRLSVSSLVVGLMLAGAASLQAQVRFGAQLDWGDDADFGLGARVNFGLGDVSRRSPVEGLVTFDYFFPDGFDYWELTGNAIYRFTQPASSSVAPYAGGGLIFGHFSGQRVSPGLVGNDSELGLHLVGGLRFKTAGTTLPFIEARFELKDSSQFVLVGGVMFGKP